MNPKLKHTLSIVMVITMILSFMPAATLATEGDEPSIPTIGGDTEENATAPAVFTVTCDIGENGTTDDETSEDVQEDFAPQNLPQITPGEGYDFAGPMLDDEVIVSSKGIEKNIANLESSYTAHDSEVLTGINNGLELTIADGATVTLKDVTIQLPEGKEDDERTYKAAITVAGTATIILQGTNTVQSGYNQAGIMVPLSANLTIQGSGTLNATGGTSAAGIGGGSEKAVGKITINGGTIKACGGQLAGDINGAGIGGGCYGAGGTITINGGIITAIGTDNGAGIGGGCYGAGGTITIKGGAITATGADNGAGIGGGQNGAGGTITISGGSTVNAIGGGNGGAGIGGGTSGAGGTVTISGATVNTSAKYGGAGIGGGYNGNGGTITINGAIVNTSGKYGGAGIGGGYKGDGGTVMISDGAKVYAESSDDAIGQGYENDNSSGSLSISGENTAVFTKSKTEPSYDLTNSSYAFTDDNTVISAKRTALDLNCEPWTNAEGMYLAITAGKSVDSIEVKNQPSKLTYMAGESLDLTGLVISIIYNDGSSEDVALADFAEKDITTDPPADGTGLTVGEHNGKPVVIKLDEHETSTNNLAVNDVPVINEINAASVSGITAPAAGETPGGAGSLIPGDTAYTVSSLTWQNEDGSPAALTAAEKFQAGWIYKAKIELTAADGNKFIDLTPTVNTGTAGAGSIDTDAENNILTFSVTFAATANKSVDTINVKTQPSKLTYMAGESLDLTGLVISIIYNDGSSENVALADFAEKDITTDPPADGTGLTVGEHNGKPVVIKLGEHETPTNNLTINNNVAPTYSIAAIDDQTMPDLNAGYSSGTQETRTITVTRTGSGNLTNLAVAISGGETGSFVITQPLTTVLNEATPSTTFTIKAKDGLAAGVYTETVTVSADNMTDMTFTVSQMVNAAALSAPVIDSTVAGDACVNISWNGVPGASGYKIYQSSTSGSYGEALATVGSSVCSYKSDGLTNGTPYYFAVKASFPEGDSVFSNEVSATPQASAHDAPTGVTARGGNEKVTLSWNPVTDATGYNIYQSTESGSYGAASATVSGSVYRHETIGLTNGVTYYFVVSATNADGESPYSAEVSAMPQTVPDAPGDVSARAGNGQATVSFSVPDDDGGTPITGYVVVSNPGNIKASGTGTTIVVKGLQNGTAYTFTVQAENAAGISQPSPASDAVTPHRSSSGGHSGGSSTSSKSASGDPGVEILVNGKVETAATAETAQLDDKTVTTITVDDKKVNEKLEKEGPESTVTIPVKNSADVVVGQLNGQTVKNMENKEAVLEIRTENVTYTLPASQINIDNVSEQIGRQVELEDIKVNVSISAPPQDTVQIVEDTADHNNYQLVVKPVEFTITCTGNNKTVEVSKFNGYVERLVAIPEGIDPDKITTGIVLNNDGTFSHVPTTIIVIDGRYYARINSLTNSTYSVIWNPETFKDVENHWAQEAVNDMGSRLVISGVGENSFEPDRDITRAEFAAIVVRGLGLMRPGTGQDVFEDVTKDCWYYDAVSIAYDYDIISGYGNDKFGPMDKITREQAMTMVARAMKITGLSVEFREGEAETLFAGFSDSGKIADWARNSAAACIKTEIVSGRKGNLIAPGENITRAEVAKMVRNLLQQSELI